MSVSKVIAQPEKIIIPTYRESPCEELPMFAENRVHQRSTGNPYPNKVVIKPREKEKFDKEYDAVRLENDYIELIILPELGGRIFSARDKRTGYDFFYRQHVIKPALIGALGSWISGGIEFNWPYHHRPSTFMPVDYTIERHKDGGATVWLSENDPFDRMQGMVGVTLRPDSLLFETEMRVSNRTPLRHSFLWWENAAVPVNPEYEIFFPPDVDHVHFHYRRSNVRYPIAAGPFNGHMLDGKGVDIRKHFNTKFATSYFSAASDYDFFGGYDNGKKCGVVHVADHHTSVGKKMFTWAYCQLTKSWERMLTDTDGEYAELMASSYSNNQPDFSWLEPYETKCFSQAWYPISQIGVPSYANRIAAVNVKNGSIKIQAVEEIKGEKLTLTCGNRNICKEKINLGAGEIKVIETVEFNDEEYEISIGDLLYFCASKKKQQPLPPLFPEVPMPNELKTAEKCYLAGLHFYQYRDPNADPREYMKAALKIEPDYIPALTFLGELYIGDFLFAEAKEVLKKAEKASNTYNITHETGKIHYLLGLACENLREDKEAYDHYRRAAWNEAYVSPAMTRASMLDSKRGDYASALKCAKEAIAHNIYNYTAIPLAAIAEYKNGDRKAAKKLLSEHQCFNPLNHFAKYAEKIVSILPDNSFYERLKSNPSQTCLDVAIDLIDAGYTDCAKELFNGLTKYTKDIAPSIAYYLGKPKLANEKHRTFPYRYFEIKALETYLEDNKDDETARYLLACAYYGKHMYDKAYTLWQFCSGADAKRNTAVYLWRKGRTKEALEQLDAAIAQDPACDQLVYEKAHLMNVIGIDYKKTVSEIEKLIPSVTETRDDTCTELAVAYNRGGEYDKAIDIINNHFFVPCEGGETFVALQHINAWVGKGKEFYNKGEYSRALDAFRTAQSIPDSLGAGIWNEFPIVPARYHEALTLIKLERAEDAKPIFEHIADLYVDYFSKSTLEELPVYQAMSLIKLGREEQADKLLDKYISEWEFEIERKDSGYFGTTPFFISYLDKAEVARCAHYAPVLDFARSVKKRTNLLLNI